MGSLICIIIFTVIDYVDAFQQWVTSVHCNSLIGLDCFSHTVAEQCNFPNRWLSRVCRLEIVNSPVICSNTQSVCDVLLPVGVCVCFMLCVSVCFTLCCPWQQKSSPSNQTGQPAVRFHSSAREQTGLINDPYSGLSSFSLSFSVSLTRAHTVSDRLKCLSSINATLS